MRHTSILTVLDGVRTGAFDPSAMLTVHEGGGVVGALLRTAGHPALVSAVPPRCAGAVVEALVARDPEVEGVQGPAEEAEVVGAAWSARTGAGATVGLRMRLFALDELACARRSRRGGPRRRPGRRARAGPARRSGGGVRPGVRPHLAARAHTRDDVVAPSGRVRVRCLGGRRRAGRPGGRPRRRAGMSRIGPVYTPPEHRGRGYAAAVTAAAARWALGRGARHVLLYTDLANPTTNRLYPRLGFRPRYDALELRFLAG